MLTMIPPIRRSITPTSELITEPAVLTYLISKDATLEPNWSDSPNPCLPSNRHERTQWGDTLHFAYWNRYLVYFDKALPAPRFAYELYLTNRNLYAEPIHLEAGDTQR
jgi:hypothetical protein